MMDGWRLHPHLRLLSLRDDWQLCPHPLSPMGGWQLRPRLLSLMDGWRLNQHLPPHPILLSRQDGWRLTRWHSMRGCLPRLRNLLLWCLQTREGWCPTPRELKPRSRPRPRRPSRSLEPRGFGRSSRQSRNS